MFYYKNWERFCKFLKESGVTLCTAQDSLTLSPNERFVVLKHDVETFVLNAYRLAEIEHRYGICGSYYVQYYLLKNQENIRLLQLMQNWGHEISYHYDVLDANAGDYNAALLDFKKNKNVFHENGFQFKTICQHGNPVKNRVGYTSNRDFFRNQDIKSQFSNLVDIVVDYSKYSHHEYKYISDVSYRWNVITLPETNDLYPDVKNVKIGDFDALENLIKNSGSSFIVSTHPHRWKASKTSIYVKIVLFRIIRALVLGAKNIPGVNQLLNKFYFLAKKI